MAIKIHDHESATNHHAVSAQDKLDISRRDYFAKHDAIRDQVAQKHGVDPLNIHQHPKAMREFRKELKPHMEAQKQLEREISSGPRGGVYHISASGQKVYEK